MQDSEVYRPQNGVKHVDGSVNHMWLRSGVELCAHNMIGFGLAVQVSRCVSCRSQLGRGLPDLVSRAVRADAAFEADSGMSLVWDVDLYIACNCLPSSPMLVLDLASIFANWENMHRMDHLKQSLIWISDARMFHNSNLREQGDEEARRASGAAQPLVPCVAFGGSAEQPV
jgi:hypothetical protein